MRKSIFRGMGAIAAVCIALVFAGPVSSAESNEETKFPIWSDIPPGETLFPEKPETGGKNATFISNIWKPSIEVIRAPEDKNTGAAVLVCPGGGYGGLAYNHEGLSVAKWLNSLGVTAVILKYRVPARPKTLRGEVPLKDAQRALSLVRSKADEWKIDPRRLGILGFSAGGHLSALTSTAPERSYEPTDEVDKFSCVPDFTILIYPAYCVENNALSPRLAVTGKTPPAFLVHSANDPYTCDSSLLYFSALRREKVSAEVHIYAKGGHGYGLRPKTYPGAVWPVQAATWLKSSGWLSPLK